jgi:hypothetical protein
LIKEEFIQLEEKGIIIPDLKRVVGVEEVLFSPLFIRFAIEYRIWLYERFIPNSK